MEELQGRQPPQVQTSLERHSSLLCHRVRQATTRHSSFTCHSCRQARTFRSLLLLTTTYTRSTIYTLAGKRKDNLQNCWEEGRQLETEKRSRGLFHYLDYIIMCSMYFFEKSTTLAIETNCPAIANLGSGPNFWKLPAG